jgi:MFS family permease
VIVQTVSWRWVFLLNVPLSAVVVVLALATRAPSAHATARARLDVVGAALAAVGLTGVTYGVVELQARGLVAVLPALALGLAALGGLVAWTLRAPDPLVPPRLLRRPGLAAANLVTLVVYAALGAYLLFVPVYAQFLGFSPTVAGLAFAPSGLALVLLAPRFGRVADRNGPRWPIAAGAFAIGVGVLLLVPVQSRADARTWGIAGLVLVALGLAALVAPITAAALGPAPEELAGVAAGLNQTVARVGGVLSVAAVGALAGWAFTRAGGTGDTPFDPTLTDGGREAGVEAFRWTAAAVAGLAFAGSALAATLLAGSRPGRRAETYACRLDEPAVASTAER